MRVLTVAAQHDQLEPHHREFVVRRLAVVPGLVVLVVCKVV